MADRYQTSLDAGWDHLRADPQRPRDADKCFREVLAKAPRHFMANFGHLVVLHHPTVVAKTRAERPRFAKIVLDHAPKRPEGTMELLAMRYAANTLAFDIYSREKDPEKLREALRYAEIGARSDPDYDDVHSPVTSTKAEILIALGREDEAYRLTEQVLAAKPTYEDFVAFARTPAFKRWHKGQLAERRRSLAAAIGDDLATDLNCAMLERVDPRNVNTSRAPLRRSIIDRIRVPRTRGDRKTTVPLPPSLKALLAYDSRLRMRGGRPFFEELLGRKPGAGTMASTTMTEVFRASSVAKGYRDLTKAAEADMPALIELPLGADQRVFMYITPKAEKNGEYPLIRFDDEPCIWVTAGCLQDEIGTVLQSAVPGAEGRLEKAKKAAAAWLAREPEQRLVEDDDD